VRIPVFIKTFILLFTLIGNQITLSQDYSWWNEKHNWDGVTPWQNYIILSPAYMGPNALPVPEARDGSLPRNTTFEFSLENHFSSGDKTINLYTNLYIPLFSKRAGLNISIVPFEHYKMDTITRDLRRARDYDGEGISGGDFYIGTFIQILKDKKFPDIVLSINMKTASGTNLAAARFTDSPGYHSEKILISKTLSSTQYALILLLVFIHGRYTAMITGKMMHFYMVLELI